MPICSSQLRPGPWQVDTDWVTQLNGLIVLQASNQLGLADFLELLVAQIVAQFRAEPARIMPNCPNWYRRKRLKTLDPTSSDTFSRPPPSTSLAPPRRIVSRIFSA